MNSSKKWMLGGIVVGILIAIVIKAKGPEGLKTFLRLA
jgi:hypothetical protein